MASKKRKPKRPSEVEATPHKIIGELLALRFNKRGQVCGDAVLPMEVFQPNFKSAARIFKARVKEEAGDGFVPVKFAGHLIGAQYNEHRVVTDEGPMATIPQIFQQDFGKIAQLIEGAAAEYKEAMKQSAKE